MMLTISIKQGDFYYVLRAYTIDRLQAACGTGLLG